MMLRSHIWQLKTCRVALGMDGKALMLQPERGAGRKTSPPGVGGSSQKAGGVTSERLRQEML